MVRLATSIFFFNPLHSEPMQGRNYRLASDVTTVLF